PPDLCRTASRHSAARVVLGGVRRLVQSNAAEILVAPPGLSICDRGGPRHVNRWIDLAAVLSRAEEVASLVADVRGAKYPLRADLALQRHIPGGQQRRPEVFGEDSPQLCRRDERGFGARTAGPAL